MDRLFTILIPIALAAVVITLFLGIYSLARGGEYARKHSNKLMRWRVGLQFVAVLILAAAFWWSGSHRP